MAGPLLTNPTIDFVLIGPINILPIIAKYTLANKHKMLTINTLFFIGFLTE